MTCKVSDIDDDLVFSAAGRAACEGGVLSLYVKWQADCIMFFCVKSQASLKSKIIYAPPGFVV